MSLTTILPRRLPRRDAPVAEFPSRAAWVAYRAALDSARYQRSVRWLGFWAFLSLGLGALAGILHRHLYP